MARLKKNNTNKAIFHIYTSIVFYGNKIESTVLCLNMNRLIISS